MKSRYASLLLILGTLALSHQACAQGTLTPPPTGGQAVGLAGPLGSSGEPMPTMKTLHQIEPRHDLLNGPWGVGSPIVDISDSRAHYVIKQPGSYYLSDNLVVAKSIGILIEADHVTLDLNGFCISEDAAATSDVQAVDAQGANVMIHNGSIATSLGVEGGNDIRQIGFYRCKSCIVSAGCHVEECRFFSVNTETPLVDVVYGFIDRCHFTGGFQNGAGTYLDLNHVVITNCVFDSIRQSSSSSANEMVVMVNTTMEDCTFIGVEAQSALIYAVANTELKNVKLLDCSSASTDDLEGLVRLGWQGQVIDGLDFLNCTGASNLLILQNADEGLVVKDVSFSDCTAETLARLGGAAIHRLNASNCTFSCGLEMFRCHAEDCQFTSNRVSEQVFYAREYSHLERCVVVSHEPVEGVDSSPVAFMEYLPSGASFVPKSSSYVDCHVKTFSGTAFEIDGTLERCSAVDVQSGVVHKGANAARIVGCRIQRSATYGLKVESDYGHVEGNVIQDCARSLDISGTGNRVVKNALSRSSTYHFSIASGNFMAQILVPTATAAMTPFTPYAGAGFVSSDPWANFAD